MNGALVKVTIYSLQGHNLHKNINLIVWGVKLDDQQVSTLSTFCTFQILLALLTNALGENVTEGLQSQSL